MLLSEGPETLSLRGCHVLGPIAEFLSALRIQTSALDQALAFLRLEILKPLVSLAQALPLFGGLLLPSTVVLPDARARLG
jgi:hypothetical protein